MLKNIKKNIMRIIKKIYKKNKRIYDSLNKEKISEYNKKYSHRRCYDPIANDYCGIINLYARKHKNKEKYKDIKVPECVINSDDLNFFIS